MKNRKLKMIGLISAFCILHFAFSNPVTAQEPAPRAPKSVRLPAVQEKKLANGLTVAVVERKNVPLVTVTLLVRGGANAESFEKAGLANMTASLLTKGTRTRSATQIAEQMEFLGGSISSGAGWNNSEVAVNVMSDKLDQALAIMSDVVLNPTFSQKEIDLLKSQIQDGLAYNLKQPSFLANYVASVYSFNEHPAGGTPESVNGISRGDILSFKNNSYYPANAVLIFTGDISAARANALAQKFFGAWKKPMGKLAGSGPGRGPTMGSRALVRRILVVDLPNSGQAAVNYSKSLEQDGRVKCDSSDRCASSPIFYPASVMNSVLGGGYSSRLNQEIRIKRGLSYGAGSSIGWRDTSANFGTRTQTKNESAAEVAELVLAEIQKLTESNVNETELNPRKLVVTGDFGRDLETTGGLADAVSSLYGFHLSPNELNSFMPSVQAVTPDQIKRFSAEFLKGGDIVIVGDYSVFKDDLAKRFGNANVQVIKAEGLKLKALGR